MNNKKFHYTYINKKGLDITFKHLWLSFYKLKYQQSSQVREGALLKWEFADGLIGHADLHPWPEKGEYPLKTHLEKLKKQEWTALTLRAREIARGEALARSKERSLLSDLKISKSHYLIYNLDLITPQTIEQLINQEFNTFKVKLNKPLTQQSKKWIKLVNIFKSKIKWRVDFQNNMTIHQWNEWKKEFLPSTILQQVDFIEAPFNYNERIWAQNKKMPLALDVWNKNKQNLPVKALVWKPARKSHKQLCKKWNLGLCKRVIFTHSLAHPVDQLATAFYAGQFYKTHPKASETCALTQIGVYKKHDFSLDNKGPSLIYPQGSGYGFDELFNKLPWKKWI